MAKKAAVAAVSLLVIVLSLYVTFRPSSPRLKLRPPDYRRPWVCERCSHTFLDLPTTGVRACPRCGDRSAVQSVVYVCGQCGGEFEAYRLKDYYGAESGTDERGRPVLPVAYVKTAGGEWTTDAAQLGPLRCPKCGNAAASTLRRKAYGRKAGP